MLYSHVKKNIFNLKIIANCKIIKPVNITKMHKLYFYYRVETLFLMIYI